MVQVTLEFREIKDHLKTSNKAVIKNFNKQIFTTAQENFLIVLHIGIGNDLHRTVSVVRLRVAMYLIITFHSVLCFFLVLVVTDVGTVARSYYFVVGSSYLQSLQLCNRN